MSRLRRKKKASGNARLAGRMSRPWVLACGGGVILVLLAGVVWAFVRPQPVAEYGYKIVNTYPHDKGAFTQGLVYEDGRLYEGTGRKGKSTVRRVELKTGKVEHFEPLPRQLFGEGIAILGDRIYQLTWKSGRGFFYDKKTLRRVGTFRYRGEGWGLTSDGRHLIMSDGTPIIRYLDPKTFREVGRIRVTSEGRTVAKLNELEYIGGEIFSNVWETNRIARISPETGRVVGWIDLRGLLRFRDRNPLKDMHLNGIAYDPAGDRLFVTGKNWPKLFEIKLIKKG